jgi:hypothetical protein
VCEVILEAALTASEGSSKLIRDDFSATVRQLSAETELLASAI